jgi:Protein of unknown function (DUF3800)
LADIYVFADETGDLGYNLETGSQFFGFGTATYLGDSTPNFEEAFKRRCALEREGISIKEGFHASNDRWKIRDQIFQSIKNEPVRFDFTFLNKANAFDAVKARGPLRLYKQACYLHFKEVARQIAEPSDVIYSVMSDIQTKARKKEIESALRDVALQVPNRTIVPIIWNSRTSWGLQVADYGLWEAQRKLNNEKVEWWNDCIAGKHATFFRPWN